MELKPIDQQVVAVVGASSGIGRETALRFARRGARVVVAARGAEGLQSLVEEIQSQGGNAIAVTADVTDFEQVKTIAQRAVETYGHLDTWVHLAAVSLYATVEQTSPEEFRHLIEVNLIGQVHGAMAALPHLRNSGGGALIHVSSVEAKRAFPLQSAYAASKHGLVGFLDSLRLELQHDGVPISVTNVMPPSINTPLFNKARTKIGVKPMGAPPFYQPGVVADAILYAAEHPIRDIVIGGVGKMMVTGQRLSPRLMDAIMDRIGFQAQQTDEPKSESAPDSLYQPLPGYNRVEGDFGDLAKSYSLATWLDTHPAARKAATVATFAALVFLLQRRR